MILTLLYHRVGKGKYANSYEMLKNHLLFLKENYPILLPGDPIKKFSLCLTFDDATFDFYHFVFPLLVKHGIRVLLGVPVRYILDKSELPSDTRLNVPYPLMMQDGIFEHKAPFCTWQELEEMVKSGYVEVASHSYMHPNLTVPFVDLEREIVQSKKMLEERLPQTISSFIYPFGKSDERTERQAKQHYAYRFRIGSEINFGWHSDKSLSRVNADCLKKVDEPLTWFKLMSYFVKRGSRLLLEEKR